MHGQPNSVGVGHGHRFGNYCGLLLIAAALPLCLGQSCGTTAPPLMDDADTVDEQVLGYQPEEPATTDPVEPDPVPWVPSDPVDPVDPVIPPITDPPTSEPEPQIDLTFEVDASRLSGPAPLSVDFAPVMSNNQPLPDGWYYWDFGDGEIAEGPDVTHVFQSAGTYTVVLCIALGSASGCSDQDAGKPANTTGVGTRSAKADKQVKVTQNSFPRVTSQDVVTNANMSIDITLNATYVAGEGATYKIDDDLAFRIVVPPSHGTVSTPTRVSSSSARVTYTPQPDYSGEDSFDVEALNGAERSPPEKIGIEINRPPAVNAGADEAILWPANVINLSATATDDGLPAAPGVLTATWSKLSGPGIVTFSDAGARVTSATFSEPGTYELTFSAADGGATAIDSMVVYVVPAVTIKASATTGLAMTFTAVGDDDQPIAALPLGTTLRWYFNDQTSSATGNPVSHTFPSARDYTVELVLDIADNSSLSLTDTVTVTMKSWEHIHDFTGLPMTEDGWTDLLAMYQHPDYYNDSRIIYVSSSDGNDVTGTWYTPNSAVVGADPFNPVAPVQPFKTLAAAYSQLRDGYPDMMLLRRGNIWADEIPAWTKSGRSQIERAILGAYGPLTEDRPIIPQFRTSYGVNQPEDAFNFTMVTSLGWTGTFNRQIGGSHFLVEDCATFNHRNSGMTIQGLGPTPLTRVAIRRCVIADRYPVYAEGTGHTQGLYATKVDQLLIEENVFDRNGWNPNGTDKDAGNIHSHNTYISAYNKYVVMRYNISTRAGSHGLQMGSGGLLLANLSVQDSIAIQMARSETDQTQGFEGIIKNNVVLQPKDIQPTLPRGWGIRILNSAGILIYGNVLGHNPDSGNPLGIFLEPDVRYGVQMQVRNVTIDSNILHDFRGNIRTQQNYPNIANIRLVRNRIHDAASDAALVVNADNSIDQIAESRQNTFYSVAGPGNWFRSVDWMGLDQWRATVNDEGSFVEATQPSGDYTIPAYLETIGEAATLDSFYQHIRAQRRGQWDHRFEAVAVVNFVRGRFGLAAVPQIAYSLPVDWDGE